MLKIIIASFVLVSGMFALFVFTAPSEPTTSDTIASPSANDTVERQTTENSIDIEDKPRLLIGDQNAPVTLVEYADFKCPACNQFHHTAGAQLRDTFVADGLVNIEFRNYPFLGPDSGRSARGSYCAHEQGVFTEYHDRVYEYIWSEYYTQDDLQAEARDVLTSEKLIELLGEDLRDPQQFLACVNSNKYNQFIDADLELGADDGITGTPGFTVGAQKIQGPSNYNTFETLIEIELDKVQ